MENNEEWSDYKQISLIEGGKNKVYTLTTSDGIVKIGRTSQHIEKRVAQLQTGNPYPIKIIDVENVSFNAPCERNIHVKLKKNHVSGEHYDIPAEEAIKVVKSECEKIENRTYMIPDDSGDISINSSLILM